MNLRTIATFAVAIFLGVLAVLMIRGVLSSRPGVTTAKAGVTPVVVTTTAVGRGEVLQPNNLKVVNFPTASVPAGSFRSVKDMADASGKPRVVVSDFVANEPVVATKLSGEGSRPSLAGILTEGMRAVSVRVSDVTGVGGYALPGDRVDVLLTRQQGSNENATNVLSVLAENIRVLGVDQTPDADKPTVAKSVTLEVTPEQAQTISLAQAVGHITLALRHTSDETPLARKAITVADLGGVRPPVVRRAAAPRAPTGASVRVARGIEISGYSVPR